MDSGFYGAASLLFFRKRGDGIKASIQHCSQTIKEALSLPLMPAPQGAAIMLRAFTGKVLQQPNYSFVISPRVATRAALSLSVLFEATLQIVDPYVAVVQFTQRGLKVGDLGSELPGLI